MILTFFVGVCVVFEVVRMDQVVATELDELGITVAQQVLSSAQPEMNRQVTQNNLVSG